jgi:CheY-like chemotaxis protein
LLLVEDNENELMSIKELLGSDDIEIVSAATGSQGLAMLREKSCDCCA